MSEIYDTNNGINSEPSSSVPWEPAKYGEQATFDDIVRVDPDLANILKPEDGFRVPYKGYKYSVKVYDYDRIIVYRQKPSFSSSSQSNGNNHNGQSGSANQFKNQKFNYRGPNFGLDNVLYIGIQEIKEVKLFKLDEGQHFLAEGWKIHPIYPIQVGNDGPYVVLVRWEVNTKE